MKSPARRISSPHRLVLFFSSSSLPFLPPYFIHSKYCHSIMSASCSALRRLTPRSSRALQARLPAVSRPSLVALNSLKSANPAAPQVSRFSTMTSLQAAAPAASPDKSYDPEIKGMADYIHKYNVDSDLAVCFR